MKKRVLSLFMALALCFSLLPTAAWATENTTEPSTQLTEPTPVPQEPETPDQGENTEPPAAEAVAPVGEVSDTADSPHTHYLCGGDTCNKVGHHEDTKTTFTAWTDSDSLPATKGNYYLTSDVTLTTTWTCNDDVTLCLNGYSIKFTPISTANPPVISVADGKTFTLTDCNSSKSSKHFKKDDSTGRWVQDDNAGTINVDGGAIFCQNDMKGGCVQIEDNSTFNMYGGTICGNGANNGGGVYVSGGCTFNMYGGKIAGNTAEFTGGGVIVHGTFTMSGGTITDNTANTANLREGGGVCVPKGGTFTMSGGSITENNAEIGGGVYVEKDSSSFNVAGNVTITGNKNADKAANNVYLRSDKTITILVAGLNQNARIGVTTAEAPEANPLIQIATGASSDTLDYARIFTPDVQNQDYEIIKIGNNLHLSGHQHSWTYTASGATITAKCSKCSASGGSVTIAAPAELTYSGEAKPATVTASSDWQGLAVNEDAISYIKTGEYGPAKLENGALPTNAGTYTASITVGDATASVEYTIDKATLTVTPNSGQSKKFGATDPTLTYAYSGEVSGETPAFDGALSRDPGDDVGTYNITKGSLALEGSGTFKASNYTLKMVSPAVKFEITKGTYGGSAPTKTVNILKNYAGVQTGTLTAADFFTTAPPEAKITNAVPNSNPSSMMSLVGADSSGNFTYDSKTNITAASDESWTVTISSKNYTDITGTLTFKLVDKTDVSAQITFPNGTLTYNGAGQKYEKATISTTAAGTPVWTYIYAPADATASLDSAGLPKTAGTYTVTAKYEDDAHIGTKSATLTVSKATPTGAPTCTKITTSGKTLADAPLAIGTIAPAGGTLAWDMAANTVVAANTAYGWTYTPADTANYKALTGSLTPYAVSSGGGGGGGGSSAATPSVSDKAAKELKNAKEGSTVTIDMKGETKLPASVTKEIAGKDVTVELDMGGGMVWSFNGLDVPKGGVRLDLGVKTGTKTIPAKVINALTGEATTIQLQLDHNGPFGMSLKLSVDLGKKHDGLYANLYFYNPKSGELEFQSAGLISGGKASWAFDHASDYAIVIDKESHEPMTFTDVPDTAYYAEAVNWAVAKKITGGVGNNLFAPNDPCTRAQIVTFLWRAAGSPGPKTMSGFSDVPADSYYAKAVAWAVENGITGGTGDGKFSPDATCTRAQAVTFLYRASGAPAVSGNAAFSDVATNAYYAAAVKWAEKNGVTGGIGGGLFGSGNDCTRAQIVTFLYRNYQSK